MYRAVSTRTLKGPRDRQHPHLQQLMALLQNRKFFIVKTARLCYIYSESPEGSQDSGRIALLANSPVVTSLQKSSRA